MKALHKFLIGLGAALACGWVAHGPLGQGDALAAQLESGGRLRIEVAEMPQVEVRIARGPLRRTAILSGPADDFQREGQGRFPGLNDRILSTPGVAGLQWEGDRPATVRAWNVPMLLEVEIAVILVFLLGLLLGWRVFRPRRESYLE